MTPKELVYGPKPPDFNSAEPLYAAASVSAVHFDDSRYPKFLIAYQIILDATPAPLREVMAPSAGTLASALVNALFPEGP